MNSQSNAPSKTSSPKSATNGALTQTGSFDLKTAKSRVKSEITMLLARNGNTKTEGENLPEICLILKVLTTQKREFPGLRSSNIKNKEELCRFYISILTDHSVAILDFEKFGSYVLFKDSQILDFEDGLVSYLDFILACLADNLTESDFRFLERLLIYFFLLSDHSTGCKTSFYKLYMRMEGSLDCQIYKTLLKICEICRLPRLKSDLLSLNGRINVVKRVTMTDCRNGDILDFGEVRKARCQEFPLSNKLFTIPNERYSVKTDHDLHSILNICSNRNARNNISEILFKSKTNRFLLSEIERIEIESSQNLALKNRKYANALLELLFESLESNLDVLDSSNNGSGIVYEESLREMYFQLRIILTILGNSEESDFEEVEISHYFGVLDAFGDSFENFDNGLSFLRLLPLSISILKDSDLKGSFKQLIEESMIEAFENDEISRNPLFVYRSLSVFVDLLKNKLVQKPSKKFRKYLKVNQKVYLEMVTPSEEGVRREREGVVLENVKLSQNKIVFRLKAVFGKLGRFEEMG